MRVFGIPLLVLLLAPVDATAQRISTWEAPAPSAAAADSLRAHAVDADVAEQAAWGVVVGAAAGLAGRAHVPEPDPSDPFGTNAQRAYDASVFEVMDFTLVGAVSAGITAAAAEWARGRLGHRP